MLDMLNYLNEAIRSFDIDPADSRPVMSFSDYQLGYMNALIDARDKLERILEQ